MDLSELPAKHDQGGVLCGIAEAVLQPVMETEVAGLIGVGRHERIGERTTWRNGYREHALDTRLGTLNMRVPKLRQGSHFPSFLEVQSDHVIDWAAKQEASIKTGFNKTVAKAKLNDVPPHVLRNTAAVHIAEAGCLWRRSPSISGTRAISASARSRLDPV